MVANGPAVEGVNVTRRSIRAESSYFSQKDVTVQGGYGAIFAIPANQKVVHRLDLSRAENRDFDKDLRTYLS